VARMKSGRGIGLGRETANEPETAELTKYVPSIPTIVLSSLSALNREMPTSAAGDAIERSGLTA